MSEVIRLFQMGSTTSHKIEISIIYPNTCNQDIEYVGTCRINRLSHTIRGKSIGKKSRGSRKLSMNG